MSNRKDQIAKRTGKPREKAPKLPEWADQRWFEVVDLFDAQGIHNVPGTDTSHRMFVLGEIGNLVILEVPVTAPAERVQEALSALAERGVRALAFTNNMRFAKLRMCNDAEVEVLDAADKESGGSGVLVAPRRPSTRSHVGPGIPVDGVRGDGDSTPDRSDRGDGVGADAQEHEEGARPTGG
jgi:hypothetical protein